MTNNLLTSTNKIFPRPNTTNLKKKLYIYGKILIQNQPIMKKEDIEKWSDEKLQTIEKALGILSIIMPFLLLFLYAVYYYEDINRTMKFLLIGVAIAIIISKILNPIKKELIKRGIEINWSKKVESKFYTVYGILILVIFTFQLGFYNDFFYGSRYDNVREANGLTPFDESFIYKKNGMTSHYWYNPNKKKQGLYQSNKQQYRRFNNLDSESDTWIYNEGDSIEIHLENSISPSRRYPQTGPITFKKKGSLLHEIKTKEDYLAALQYLKHREDSLQLNKK